MTNYNFSIASLPASYRVLGDVPLGEGVAENAAGGWSEGKAFPSCINF